MRPLFFVAALAVLFAAGCASGTEQSPSPKPTNNGTATSTSDLPSGWNTLAMAVGTSTVSVAFPGTANATNGLENLIIDAALGSAVENPGTKSVPSRTLRVFAVPPNDPRIEGCAFSEQGWEGGRVPSSTPNLRFAPSPYAFCRHTEVDAATGNRYAVQTYATPVQGNVLVVEFIVHSVVCENFENPAEQCVAYDEARDTALFPQILRSIR